jgi:hypothetical protein
VVLLWCVCMWSCVQAKVTKKNKPYAPDPRNDPTKLISVPCFICRPQEFKLLRETMTDRNVYAATYTDYLKENYQFCHEMAMKNGYRNEHTTRSPAIQYTVHCTCPSECVDHPFSCSRPLPLCPCAEVLRGTWDVAHYLAWCEEHKQKPRASSRKQYFQEMAEAAVAGKIDEPKPSFERYISDTGKQWSVCG